MFGNSTYDVTKAERIEKLKEIFKVDKFPLNLDSK